MSQKSLIESKWTSVSSWRPLIATNSAILRLLSSAQAEVQVRRDANLVPSRVGTQQNSDLKTSAILGAICGTKQRTHYGGAAA